MQNFEMPSIVLIQFESQRRPGTYNGKEYSYIADVPLAVGDIVKVPTSSGESSARVSRVDVPISEIGCRVGELRHITEAPTVGGDMFAAFYDSDNTTTQKENPMEEITTVPDNQPPVQLIVIKQLPVIEEHLRSIKEQTEATVKQALSLVCCDDTVQSVKATRAELRKQFDALEVQRKQVKAAIMAPYDQFDAVYKECVTNIFGPADAELKAKIDDTETGMKKLCEDACRKYFAELLAGRGMEWLRYESAGIKVGLTEAKSKTQPPKKLATQLAQFVERVAQDVVTICGMDDADEIMVEYKKTLNLAGAVSTIQQRKEAIAKAAEARAKAEEARRAEQERIAHVQSFAPPAPAPVAAPVPVDAPVPVEQSVASTVEADPDDKIMCVRFEVCGTRRELRALKQYLIDNKYKFK